MRFVFILQAALTGLMTGGVYALIAAGLTLIFGVMKIINFAHGEFLMIAMFITFFLTTGLGLLPYFAILVAVPMLFLIGVGIFVITLKPAMKASDLTKVLVTVGVSLFLQNICLYFFTGNFRTLDVSYSQHKVTLGGLVISFPHLAAFGSSIIVLSSLHWILRYTDFGRSLRAASENASAAFLVGVNVDRIQIISFGIGSACLGIAGPLLAPIYYTTPTIGSHFVMAAFIVVVLGGMGSLNGALIGGFLVGMVESLGGLFMPGSMGPLASVLLMIVTLLLRPRGLLGGKRC